MNPNEFLESGEEHAKKEWMKMRIEFDQSQQRISVLQGENQRLRDKYNTIDQNLKDTRDAYEEKVKEFTRQIKSLEESKEEQSKTIDELTTEIESNEGKANDALDEINSKFKREIIELNGQIQDLVAKNHGLEEFGKMKDVLESQTAQLQNEIKSEKKDRQNEVNKLEREKIKATEQLRKEMLHKIKETKANLLALNDEQLQTTTRLTILQNHQLTTELEYQSKQTEQLLYKNNQMKAQIDTLKRDVQIHKEVEQELAKRSHFCQKVIKRLKQQVKDMEDQQHKQIYSNGGAVMGLGQQKKSIGGRNMGNSGLKYQTLDPSMNKANEDLINFLEHKLEEIEKKLIKTQQEYELLQSDYIDLQDRTNISREKYKRAALLMTEFLDDILSQTPNILESDKDMHLNLEKIKETPIERLDKEDKVALVLVLLKQLQPYLSANNLSTVPPANLMKPQQNLSQQQQQQMQMQMQMQGMSNDQIQQHTDEILQQHGASGTAAEVDALNSILNNINVQTKNNNNYQQSNTLPPIN